MRFKRGFVHLGLWVVLAIAPMALFGQGFPGGVRGTVTDPSGGVVPGATVRATNVATGVARSTVTTAAGSYDIPSLRPAAYRIEVETAGFKKLVRDNVTVPVGVVVGLDLTLEVGQTTQTIVVKAAAPVVQKETSQLDTSVNPRSYLDLPISAGGSRSVETFIKLAPGVYGTDSFSSSANGGQRFSRQVKIDGLDVSNVLSQPGDTSKVLTFPPDAVQEFTYVTLTLPAEYGNNQSGTIAYTIRSGTNQLHGSAYEFYRGNVFQARNFFQGNLTRFNQNEYGFTLGGPVYIPHVYNGKGRTFWFFNFNGFSTRSKPQSQFVTVPTAKQHNGDFSDYPYPIYDPATTRSVPGGGFTRDPFPGNIIPANRISPISALIASAIPQPAASAGLSNNFFAPSISTQGFRNETFKIDEVLNERHRFSFTFNKNASTSYSCSDSCYNPVNTTEPTVTAAINSAYGFNAKHNFDHLNYDLTISPTTLFHASLGLERYSQGETGDSYGHAWEDILGIENLGNGGTFPTVSFSSIYQRTIGHGCCKQFVGTVPQLSESFTLVRGRNTFKFGGDHQWYSNQGFGSNSESFDFSPLETALPSSPQNTGNPFASFLLGEVHSGSRGITRISTDVLYWYQGLYLQDDIKWSRKLTINVGLRYEVFAPWKDKGDNLSIMDPHTPNPGCGGCPGAMIFAGFGPGRVGRRRLTPPIVKDNFGPRIGFAYALKPTLVIRTGYAITHEMPGVAGSNGNRGTSAGFNGGVTFSSTDNGVSPAFNWNDGFPAFTPPPFIDPTLNLHSGVSIFDINASHPAYLQQWHFNIQESFRPDWLLDVGYVGSKGTRLYSGANNPNQTDSKYLSLGPLLNASIDNPAVVAAGFTAPYPGFQGSLAQALRPWPQYTDVRSAGGGLLSGVQDGNSTYHSLQMKLQHNFSQGLWLLASYTWQKWITNAPTTAGAGAGAISTEGGFEGMSARDQYNRRLEHGLGPIPPQMFNMGFNYELPFGPGKRRAGSSRGIVGAFLKGWQANGTLSYASGRPLTVRVNNTLPIYNDINFPNVVSGVPQILNHDISTPRGPGRQLYLNPAAFSQPAPFTYGNAAQTLDIRGFATYGENLSLMKRIYFAGERANFEIRFETFNTFNRHFWTGFVSNLNDPNFGSVTSVSGGRTAQIAGKIVF